MKERLQETQLEVQEYKIKLEKALQVSAREFLVSGKFMRRRRISIGNFASPSNSRFQLQAKEELERKYANVEEDLKVCELGALFAPSLLHMAISFDRGYSRRL